MNRFVDERATDEIRLMGGDTVLVRQRLTATESAQLKRDLFRLKMDAETGKAVAEEGDWHLRKIKLVRAYIVGWDFKDDDGNPIPFAPELVGRLDEDDVDEIATAIDKLQELRREKRQKKVSTT